MFYKYIKYNIWDLKNMTTLKYIYQNLKKRPQICGTVISECFAGDDLYHKLMDPVTTAN